MDQESRKQKSKRWFEGLRDKICYSFEEIERTYCEHQYGTSPSQTGQCSKKPWKRPSTDQETGGGIMSVMYGQVFEKVGVNVSTVYGEFSPEFLKEIPGAEENPNFWASGISLVAHPLSPLIPPVHMNTRHIITQQEWFGGGADLNPIYPDAEETKFFHEKFKHCCENYKKGSYQKFKQRRFT